MRDGSLAGAGNKAAGGVRSRSARSAIAHSLMAASLSLGVAGELLAADKLAEPVVSLAFVGDIMLDTLPGAQIKAGRDPFTHVARILQTADIRIGNLECVIATKGQPEDKPWTFRANPRTINVLKRHFTALSVANNHAGDFGPAAFTQMLDLLDSKKLSYFGGGRNLTDAHAPLMVERNGLRIALLGYSEVFPRSFEANYDAPGQAWSEDEQVVADIGNAREVHGADLVVTFMHWGVEHEPRANERQRQLARVMIDAGADAVIGGHPHVVQDIEQYKGKPIFYSLGNFVFDGFEDKENLTGWLVRLEMDRAGVTGWQRYVTQIDSKGIPRPESPRPSSCWKRGQPAEAQCDVQPAPDTPLPQASGGPARAAAAQAQRSSSSTGSK